MKPLLLLHERHTAEDGDIWRVAIKRGWTTERVNQFNVASRVKGFEHVRYYGNTLHQAMIADRIPIEFDPIPETILAASPLTKRRINLRRFSEVDTKTFDQPYFVKPAGAKWFERKVYEPGEPVLGAGQPDDLVYVSDVVDFIDEVRCFVVAGVILTSSYYRINRQVWDLSGLDESEINFDIHLSSTPLPEMAASIYRDNPVLRAVVMDFGRLKNGEWALIEFNEPWASGLYLCDPEGCFDCVVESQRDRVVN